MLDAADIFLDQCAEDGLITQAERDGVRLNRESSGCVRPEWKTWGYGVLHDKLTQRDCEIYINYPAWSLADIAEHLGITFSAVRAALRRVRRELPSLKNDPDARLGLPNLLRMVPLDAPNIPEPDPERTLKF